MGWIVIAMAVAIIVGNVVFAFKYPKFLLAIWAGMAIMVTLFWDDFRLLFDLILHMILALWET